MQPKTIARLPTEAEITSRWNSVNPLVSVVCITHNQERYIRDTLCGILIQDTSFPYEIVIGEDKSTDKTFEIIEEYRLRYPNLIRILHSESGNLGAVRNGLRTGDAARGKFIALCEGDDYWEDPKKLEIQVAFLETHPTFVLCFHDVKVVDETDAVIKESFVPAAARRDWTSEGLIMARATPIPTASLCFRNLNIHYPAEFHNLANGGLEYPYLSLLGQHGGAGYLDSIKPAAYRRHGGGMWSKLSQSEKVAANLTCFYMMMKYYERVTPQYGRMWRERFLTYALSKSAEDSRRDRTGMERWIMAVERKALRLLFLGERVLYSAFSKREHSPGRIPLTQDHNKLRELER